MAKSEFDQIYDLQLLQITLVASLSRQAHLSLKRTWIRSTDSDQRCAGAAAVVETPPQR